MDGTGDEARIAALARLVESNPDAALHEVGTLASWWQEIGRVEDGRRLTELALQRSGHGATAPRVEALLAASELAFRQGDQDVASQRSAEALEIAHAIGKLHLAALAHVDLARVAYREGDAPAIEKHARAAARLAGDDQRARRGALHMLAWAAHTAGDRGLARNRFEESLDYRRQIGDPLSIAVEIANLGDLAAEDGDLGEAADRLCAALERMRDHDNRYFVVNTLPSVAAVAGLAGLDDACARLVGAGDAMAIATGLVPDPGNWSPVIDQVAARLGQRFEALRVEGAQLDATSAAALAIDTARSIADGARTGAGDDPG